MAGIPVYTVEEKIAEHLLASIQKALPKCQLQLGRCLVPTSLNIEAGIVKIYPSVDQRYGVYFWRLRIRSRRSPLVYVKVSSETNTIVLQLIGKMLDGIITQKMFEEAVALTAESFDLPGITLLEKVIQKDPGIITLSGVGG